MKFSLPSAHPSSSSFSRRDALRGIGLASAAVATTSLLGNTSTLAQTTQPTTSGSADLQGAGFYRKTVGSFEVFLLSDGTFPFDPPYPLFGSNTDQASVERALIEQFIPYNATLGHVNALVIKTGRDVVLVDTGTAGLLGPDTGRLARGLANAGMSPKDVTALVVTHAHPDHVGALMPGPGKIDFPNAQYFVHKAELDFWLGTNPDLSRSGVADAMKPTLLTVASTTLNTIKPKATILEGDKPNKIVEGVEAILAPGHTPGHMVVRIGSGADQLFYITDAAHHFAINFPHPDWYVGFDTDRDLAVKTRKIILDQASSDRVWVAGAHLPFPALGHVRAKSGAFEWAPGVWQWS